MGVKALLLAGVAGLAAFSAPAGSFPDPFDICLLAPEYASQPCMQEVEALPWLCRSGLQKVPEVFASGSELPSRFVLFSRGSARARARKVLYRIDEAVCALL